MVTQTFDNPEDLAAAFVAMIKSGSRSFAERILIRDALLDGVLQHNVVRRIVRDADYAVDALEDAHLPRGQARR